VGRGQQEEKKKKKEEKGDGKKKGREKRTQLVSQPRYRPPTHV
jgi:hypothetical protein